MFSLILCKFYSVLSQCLKYVIPDLFNPCTFLNYVQCTSMAIMHLTKMGTYHTQPICVLFLSPVHSF